MAELQKLTLREQEELADWLDNLPLKCKEVATKYPPNRLYLLKSTNQRVFIVSYYEDGTLGVFVSGKYNLTQFERKVFGIQPADLVECDLPNPNQPVGTILKSDEEIEEFIKKTGTKERLRASRFQDN